MMTEEELHFKYEKLVDSLRTTQNYVEFAFSEDCSYYLEHDYPAHTAVTFPEEEWDKFFRATKWH